MLFSDQNAIVVGLQPDADRWTGNPQTDVISIKNADHVTFIVSEGAGGAGYGTITMQACPNFTPTGTVDMGFRYRLTATTVTEVTDEAWASVAATGLLTTAGANKLIVIEVDAAEIRAAGEKHTTPFVAVGVALTMTETDSTAVDAVILAVLSGLRYPGPAYPSNLA